MKTETQLLAKINAMSIKDLRAFAAAVVTTLYGEFTDDEGNELSEFKLNRDKDWDSSFVDDVAEDIENAGLHPDSL